MKYKSLHANDLLLSHEVHSVDVNAVGSLQCGELNMARAKHRGGKGEENRGQKIMLCLAAHFFHGL